MRPSRCPIPNLRLVPLLLSAALVLLAALLASAGSAGDLSAHDAWVREPPPRANAAAYLTLRNAGNQSLHVVSATSNAAARVELHESVVEDGIARMRPVERIEVPAGGEVRLEPGGLHVMLIEPEGLVAGATVTLRLELAEGDALSVEAPVRKSASGPVGAHGGHETHGAHGH